MWEPECGVEERIDYAKLDIVNTYKKLVFGRKKREKLGLIGRQDSL